ncbi:MAG: L,D-transpeptidase family protein [Enhydrobacter sp.]|nr:L,D-transpeptidase family protein [Enhydrobacter sp.]
MAASLEAQVGFGKAPAARTAIVLLAIAGTLAAAGCAATDPPPVAAPVTETATDLAPSPYLAMLRDHGIGASIPSRGKFVLVNIPSFELIALEDGVPVLRSRVVVGRPGNTTPEMLSSMFAVRFNPSWTPTPSMVRNEGLRYMPPGPRNPLGRIMFDLDNEEFIYLHDTNDRTLFNRTQRALSHGCIRVEQVRPLAAWALGVSEKEIDSMISRGTHSVALPEAIPVSLAYYTQFPDQNGEIASYADIYGSRHGTQLVAARARASVGAH